MNMMLMKIPLACLFLFLAPSGISHANPVANATAWNARRAGNPLVPGYFADPCSRKFGDTYYIYATPDGWDMGAGPAGVWTSKDFAHWSWQPMNWPKTDCKWAPSVVQRNGKSYMYISVPCQVWAAVADSPTGPWSNLAGEGNPLIPDQTPKGTITLDGECFLDDGGQAYLWYGTWWHPTMVKLKPDMRTPDGQAIQYFKHPGNPNPPRGLVQGCMEAPYMFKRKGIYYLMYSDAMCQDSTYNVKYCTSRSPDGPFDYDANRNPILETNDDDTVDGPGHHSMLVDGDKVFIVYHRHDNPHHPDGAHRQVCVDELHFNPDSSIEKVVPSHLGVGFLAPSAVRDTNLAFGKPARASSFSGPDFKPEYAVDENNGTLWKAAANTYPQWLEVDLGKSSSIKRVETEFEYPQVTNRYLIECSDDAQTWRMFADRKDNREAGIMVDRGDTRARYVRITLLGNDSHRPDQGPALWGLRVYDGIDKPNQAPVVVAGPDLELNFRFPQVMLDGAVHDDGLPNGPVAVRWSKASGPGNVAFAHPDRCHTEATVDQPGRYVLSLVADDGSLKGDGQLTVNFQSPNERVLAYDFDEESGTLVKDSSGCGRDGVFRKSPARGIGMHRRALNLHGAEDYVAVPPLGTLNDLTVALWLNLHEARREPSGILCSDGQSPGGLRLLIDPEGAIRFEIAGQPAQASNFRFTAEHLGEWRHLAVIYDRAAKTVTFYINGKPDVTRTLAEAPALLLTSPLRLGGAETGARGLAAEVDDFCLLEQPLPVEKVVALAVPVTCPKICDVRKLADGTAVVLVSKPVTLTPSNPLTFERATDYFYISEPDGSAGIRVEDGKFHPDQVRADTYVSVAGVMRTKASGERYVELTAPPSPGASRAAVAIAVKPTELPGAAAKLVKLAGVAKSVAADGTSFTLAAAGGAGPEVKVEVGRFVSARKPAAGHTVAVTGVVAAEGDGAATARLVMLLRGLEQLNPPPSPALAIYPFDEESGEAIRDSSPNKLDAAVAAGGRRVPGKHGRALRFDGEKTSVQVPDLGLQQALTVAAWLNLASFGKDTFASSIVHGDGWNLGALHFMVLRENGHIRAGLNGIGDLDSRFAFSNNVFGQWVHVALTYDAKTRKLLLYVNGQLDATGGVGTPRPVDLSHVRIGSWEGHGRMWDGMMDDFHFYDQALDAGEIAKLARDSTPPK